MIDVTLHPIPDPKTGQVILYDIYMDGKWQGSRRTIDQCGKVIGVPDLFKRIINTTQLGGQYLRAT